MRSLTMSCGQIAEPRADEKLFTDLAYDAYRNITFVNDEDFLDKDQKLRLRRQKRRQKLAVRNGYS